MTTASWQESGGLANDGPTPNSRLATEPLAADSRLWTLDDVLVTPHAAALSARENAPIVELLVANLRRYLDGEPLVNVVESGVSYEKYLGAPGDILLPS